MQKGMTAWIPSFLLYGKDTVTGTCFTGVWGVVVFPVAERTMYLAEHVENLISEPRNNRENNHSPYPGKTSPL